MYRWCHSRVKCRWHRCRAFWYGGVRAVAFGGIFAAMLTAHAASEELRELATDRPDKTESAHTVDRGHFQVEVDLVNYARDHDADADITTHTVGVGIANYKYGVSRTLDLQIITESFVYQAERDHGASTTTTRQGVGDITPRVKWNFIGNDDGIFSLAAMPYVKFPTNRQNLGNDAIEGGAVFPMIYVLPRGFEFGAQVQFDINRNSGNTKYHGEFSHTLELSHDLFGPLAGYVEWFSTVSGESAAPWISTIDAGITIALHKQFRLDCGVNVGVTRAADDVNPFVGFSMKI